MSIADRFAKFDNGNGEIVEVHKKYTLLKSGKQKEVIISGRGRIYAKGNHKVVIEEVSKDEYYLLDGTFTRERQICGCTVRNGTKDPCLNKPGNFTAHRGFGACNFHDKGRNRLVKLFDRFIATKKADGSIMSYYNAAKNIPDEEIEDLYPQAKMILAFQTLFKNAVEKRIEDTKVLIDENDGRTVFQNENGDVIQLYISWEPGEIAFYTQLQKQYKEMVTAGYKLKRGFYFTPKAIESMFDKILEIAKNVIGEERALQLHTMYVQETLFDVDSMLTGDNPRVLEDGTYNKLQADSILTGVNNGKIYKKNRD